VRVEENLENHGKHSAKARENWCKTKAKNLREDAAAVAAGEKSTERTLVAKSIEGYYEAKESELQPATLVAYKQGTKPFEIWCAKNAVVYIQELSPPLLARYREWFVGQNAYAPATGKGAGKGKRVEGRRKKSSAQENKCLNSLRVILSQLRREGRVPLMTRDDIVDSLKFVKRERAKRRYLDTAQIKLLLEAAKRHDAAGHDAIAPFIAACLLTGMRFTELCDLTLGEVNTTAGEIHLAAQRTKTSTERTVYLDKMPTLLAWLKERSEAAGPKSRVFPQLTFAIARMARARMMDSSEEGFSAPPFTFHRLRATCGTYSVCSSLYGRGSEHETAKQLGHSITVAQTHYTGRAKDFQPNAATLEEAMQCKAEFADSFSPHPKPTERRVN
jgi:integrase